jgi:beta-lactamase regulating signal transducer with metallopeptidase domain
MTFWNSFVDRWWSWIVPASWQLAVLVCLIVAITRCLRHRSPRLRHALWLLVLLKVFLPTNLELPFAIGHWGIRPLWQTFQTNFETHPISDSRADDEVTDEVAQDDDMIEADETSRPLVTTRTIRWAQTLCSIWAVGCLVYLTWIVASHVAIARWLRTGTVVDEGPLRIAMERIAIKLGLQRVPELMTTKTLASPCLVGTVRPHVVLPDSLVEALSERDLTAILTHELVHWRHGDTLIGLVQILAQSLFWFHPAIWWADAELRHERECACDEASLRVGQLDPQQYGESLFRVLMATRSQTMNASVLTGVFERGSRLQNRMEEIMSYHSRRQRFGWLSGFALVAIALLILPMAPGSIIDRNVQALGEDQTNKTKKNEKKTPYPTIVKTVPDIGATDVSVDLKEIKVTFDRDMDTGRMSWTGGPPLFPPTNPDKDAYWLNKRTCVLPVELEKGSFYRLGLNSKSFQNFRNTKGIPIPPTSLFFVTEGAAQDVKDRVRVPKVVKFDPENGDQKVDPITTHIRLTFDVPMGGGMSWTGGGEDFPGTDDEPAEWSEDKLTCTMPVKLKPNHEYRVGVNSLNHNNFQSEWGIQVVPVIYSFKTGNPQPIPSGF